MDTHPTASSAFSRRAALALGTAVLAGAVFRPHVARAAGPFTQPPLPYKEDELVPTISARTVGLHYGKHHKGYYDKLNTLVQGKPYADMSLSEVVVAARKANDADVFNNAAQAWNHDLYWASFKGGPAAPTGAFAQAVEKEFQSVVGLQRKMVEAGDKVFGTGWVWLVRDGDKLAIIGMKDAANPLPDGKKVLLGIDVWEHAYYLDYENRRTAHVEAVLKDLVNWQVVSERFG
ncbi:superoxide dismutase [Azorhizobium oxalatiphilum]|uniref:Superoxide dismutase n=1 Tax=Azorhizobium oxalatiphilum TaxID=980631 RepID=A0A917BNU2_9HYPH|nr:superoxide dismutase [Azorhizobium oxalatiphilum]GGF53392.1 superoxide dismutase [Azorhizobium oxalatiphilum]